MITGKQTASRASISFSHISILSDLFRVSKFGFRILLLLGVLQLAAHAAPHPIIVGGYYSFLLGTSEDGKWTPVEKIKNTVKGGETYRFYNLTKAVGTAKGGKPESAGEPCPDMFTVPFKTKPEEDVVGVAGDWNALPRVPQKAATTQPVYQQAVADFLTAKGLKKPKVRISQILRIDLDGDGEEEVLISATNYDTKDDEVPAGAGPGHYSCVILRRVVEGKVQTQLLTGEFYTKKENFSAPYRHVVRAILDLDGDGKMEVVIHSAYYEGDSNTVFRCTGKKPEQLLSIGCGA